MPIGNDSRASWPSDPLPPSEPTDLLADRVRNGPLEPDAGAARVVRPRLEQGGRCSSARPDRRSRARRPRAPARTGSPRAESRRPRRAAEPSTDASTSVFWDGRPSNTRAELHAAPRCPRRCPGRPGCSPASRAATITICATRIVRRGADHVHELASRMREALRLVVPSPAGTRVRRTRPPQRGGREVPAAARRAGPGRRSRSSRHRVGRLGAVEQHVRGQPLRQRPGRLSSENIANTIASRAGTNAALYTRGSITAVTPQPTILRVRAAMLPLASCSSTTSTPSRSCSRIRCARRDTTSFPRSTGGEALERLRDGNFDLVVLDVMLPRIDGFDVCRRARARSTVPIIMLTAKTEEIDKVLGLELGRGRLHHQAVLGARVPQPREGGAAARRAASPTATSSRSRSRPASCAIDFEKRQVEVRGESVRLTYVEFEILAALARAPGACSAAPCCSSACGATPPTATRARSTSTSATCARSSSWTRRRPS